MVSVLFLLGVLRSENLANVFSDCGNVVFNRDYRKGNGSNLQHCFDAWHFVLPF